MNALTYAIDARTKERARGRALQIGERLLRTHNDGSRGIAGSAGDAILHLALAYATGDSRYEAAMHAALKRAATGDHGNANGLFDGTSGLRAAATLAMRIEPRYRTLVEKCDAIVESGLPERPHAALTYSTFDVISGWAGMRLARCVDGPGEADALTELLVWMLADPRRWRCAHPSFETNTAVNDLGVAHGIAGVLAAVALTHERIATHLRDAVARAGAFLEACALERHGFAEWPHSLGRAPIERNVSAWCYGTPGISAALHAAAVAIGDESLRAFALRAAREVAQRPARDWLVSELGLCHGLLGNALCFASVGAAAGCDRLRAAAERCALEALEALDATDGACTSRNENGPYDATNELTGVAGIALALLAIGGDAPSQWMRLHALAPL